MPKLGRTARLRALKSAAALTLVLGFALHAPSAQAEFPGELWRVDFVKVEGAGGGEVDPGVAASVAAALQRANDTYFYGDRRTRMVATVDGTRVVRVRILDSLTGQSIASYGGGGDSSSPDSVTGAALAWMDTLGCDGSDCGRAVVEAPRAPVQQAETSAPEPANTPEPQPEAVPAAEPAVATAPEIEPVVAAVPEAPAPEAQPNVFGQPEAPTAEPQVAVEPEAGTTLAGVTAPGAAPSAGADNGSGPLLGSAVVEPNITGSLAAIEAPASAQVNADRGGQATPTVQPTLTEPGTGNTAPESLSPLGTPTSPGASERAPALAALATEPQTPTASAQGVPAGASGLPETGGAETAPDLGAGPSEPSGEIVIANPILSPSASAADRASRVPEAGVQEVAPGLTLPEPGAATGALALAPSTAPQTPVDSTPSAPTTPRLALADPAADTAAPGPQPGLAGTAPAAGAAEGGVSLPSPSAIGEPSTGVQPAQPSTPGTAATTVPSDGNTVRRQPAPQPTEPVATLPRTSEPVRPADGQAPAPSGDAEIARPTGPIVTELRNPAVAAATAAAATAVPQAPTGEDTQLALASPPEAEIRNPASAAIEPTVSSPDIEPVKPPAQDTKVETRIASVDPTAEGPTLANAQWVGFTPAVFTGADNRPGAWISGPFDRKQRTGWITDTSTGATTRVTFIWRDAGNGQRRAQLSRAAAKALGLGQGDVANIAVYLPR